jgi:FkbM family methyltransferase
MNKAIIKARSIARRLRINRLLYLLVPKVNPEEKFQEAIFAELRPGDLVWDVGANIGLYTKPFAERTGHTGRVVAFEPVPATYAELCRQTSQFPWVKNEQIALSDFDGAARLLVSDSDTMGSLEGFAGEANATNSIEVKVMCGDSYRASSRTTPNLLKIDVEGFEEEVLAGMTGLLEAPELRAIFLEVHFGILESRGRAEAPLRIEKLVQSKGMTSRWVDSSHLVAKRDPAPPSRP